VVLKKEKKGDLPKTRKYSIIEGSFASIAGGAGDSYIVPYALALNANNVHIGLLSSFAGILGPLSQIFGSRFMEKFDRKNLVTFFVALQSMMWLMFLLIGYLFLNNFAPKLIIPFVILIYISYIMLGSFAGPPWFSIMGDIVPERMRGKYFSKRNRICGGVSLIVAFSAAIFLDYMGKTNMIIYGFMGLFAISAFGRITSAYFFSKHEPPELKIEKGYYFSFFNFIQKAPFNNFGRFTIFVALLNFCVNIAAPFYAVYMLKELGFNYIWFISVTLAVSLFNIIFISFWGKFADKYGNKEMMRVTSFLIPFLPFFWVFSSSPIYLILVPQLLAGLAWGGFNLAASNFIHDAVTSQKKGIVVAYYSMLNGLGVFLGAGLGGILAQYLNISFMNIFFFLFILTGILSMAVIFVMIPKISEVRQEIVPPQKNPFMYIREVRPFFGFYRIRASYLGRFKLVSSKFRKK